MIDGSGSGRPKNISVKRIRLRIRIRIRYTACKSMLWTTSYHVLCCQLCGSGMIYSGLDTTLKLTKYRCTVSVDFIRFKYVVPVPVLAKYKQGFPKMFFMQLTTGLTHNCLLYFSSISLDWSTYGIEAGSRIFFQIRKLTIIECRGTGLWQIIVTGVRPWWGIFFYF